MKETWHERPGRDRDAPIHNLLRSVYGVQKSLKRREKSEIVLKLCSAQTSTIQNLNPKFDKPRYDDPDFRFLLKTICPNFVPPSKSYWTIRPRCPRHPLVNNLSVSNSGYTRFSTNHRISINLSRHSSLRHGQIIDRCGGGTVYMPASMERSVPRGCALSGASSWHANYSDGLCWRHRRVRPLSLFRRNKHQYLGPRLEQHCIRRDTNLRHQQKPSFDLWPMSLLQQSKLQRHLWQCGWRVGLTIYYEFGLPRSDWRG